MARVLHLIGNFEEHKGGAQRVVIDLINTCNSSNIEIGVCSLFGNATLSNQVPADIFNVNLRYRYKYNPRILTDLYDVMSKWKPDIVHIHSSVAGFFGRPIANYLGIRQVTTVHNDVQEAPLRNRLIDRFTMGLSDSIICVSETVMDSVLREYRRYIDQNTRVIRIPNCIDCEAFKRSIKQDAHSKKKQLRLDQKDFLVGTVGRLHPVKGHRYLIEAWKEVCTSHPQSALVLVGDGSERNRLEQRVDELKMADSVFFLGARDDVPEILNLLDLFVFPSLSEGLPISLLEAMCMGKVIVASDIKPVKQVLGDTGILVPPGDSKSLGEQIKCVLSDFEGKINSGRKARARVLKNFTPEEFGSKYLAVYNELIQK